MSQTPLMPLLAKTATQPILRAGQGPHTLGNDSDIPDTGSFEAVMKQGTGHPAKDPEPNPLLAHEGEDDDTTSLSDASARAEEQSVENAAASPKKPAQSEDNTQEPVPHSPAKDVPGIAVAQPSVVATAANSIQDDPGRLPAQTGLATPTPSTAEAAVRLAHSPKTDPAPSSQRGGVIDRKTQSFLASAALPAEAAAKLGGRNLSSPSAVSFPISVEGGRTGLQGDVSIPAAQQTVSNRAIPEQISDSQLPEFTGEHGRAAKPQGAPRVEAFRRSAATDVTRPNAPDLDSKAPTADTATPQTQRAGPPDTRPRTQSTQPVFATPHGAQRPVEPINSPQQGLEVRLSQHAITNPSATTQPAQDATMPGPQSDLSLLRETAQRDQPMHAPRLSRQDAPLPTPPQPPIATPTPLGTFVSPPAAPLLAPARAELSLDGAEARLTDLPLSVTTRDILAPPPANPLNRPELPPMIARQLGEALTNTQGRPVEIALNPQELGRVRIALHMTEAGITVSLIAERPETIDLMRRHIDQLGQEFHAMGYEEVAFSFGNSNPDATPSDQGERVPAAAPHTDLDIDDTATVALPASAAAGLDLRL